jgi:predicted nuclease of restriction endonuclease-like (RecB) superfamily
MERRVTDNQPNGQDEFYRRIRQILEAARVGVARTVNSVQVMSNWLIGQAIVEEEQQGRQQTEYGEHLLKNLAAKLKKDFGAGYSLANLKYIRQFYLSFPDLLNQMEIGHAVRDQFDLSAKEEIFMAQMPSEKTWQPGQLHPNLSWTHYRTLMRVERTEARAFYEIESLNNNWSSRELERQINSLLFERLAMSRDKEGLLQLAKEGQVIQQPADIFKDPVVIEFLGLPESPRLVESHLETALVSNLQEFLLELGKGFAFVSRQERITLDGDHFYIDLVFYHTILKCFILIDLKVGKLNHGDLGQLQLYVNYYDQERCTEGDNPTLGLILCSDKNDAVVKYTLGPAQESKIFASRYKLHLPSEAELQAELRREVSLLTTGKTPKTRRKQAPPEI